MPRFRLALAVLWTLGILLATTLPMGDVPDVEVSHFDKAVHFALFFGFGFLWMWALTLRIARRATLVLMIGAIGAFGTEGLQWLMSFERTADLADGVANLLGLLGGVGVFTLMHVILTRATEPSARSAL